MQHAMLQASLTRLKTHLVDRFSKYRDCFPATTSQAAAGKDAFALLRQVREGHREGRLGPSPNLTERVCCLLTRAGACNR